MLKTSMMLRGADDVLARLDRLDRGVDNTDKAFDAIGDLFVNREKAVFSGDGWAPLKRSTILRTGPAPLVDFGLMKAGILSAGPIWVGDHAPAAAYGAEKYDRRVWNLAVLHTFGFTDRGGTKVRPRLVVPRLRVGERATWVGVMRKHVHQAVKDA